MTWTRGAVTLTLATAFLALAIGCGSSGGKAEGGAGTAGRGGAGGGGGADAAPPDGPPDLATDFGEPMTSDVAINCPTRGGSLEPATPALIIDDFSGSGGLDGRSHVRAGFDVKEQFDSTAGASFEPAPGIELKCGAAAPGAAHFRGKAADTGATFAVIFSSAGDGGKPNSWYDASATKGITFRVALGDAKATKLVTVQVNLAEPNKFDYTKDVIIDGTAWQEVKILWTELSAAPAAPPFSAATLNQLVIPFAANENVDLYVDDLAFMPP